MDPTLAALLGAGVGSLVTALSPWMTGRIQHRSRRREVMREAYLRGMRAVAEVGRVNAPEDILRVKGELWEARLHIRLVGSQRASAKFNILHDSTEKWLDVALEEHHLSASKRFSKAAADEAVAELRQSHELADVGTLNEGFVSSARLDMGMEDRLRTRAWRRLQGAPRSKLAHDERQR